MRHDIVMQFIAHFQNEGTVERFTNGCCYWFAQILCGRFKRGRMYYNPVDGHFATKIDGRIYDITGEIPPSKDWLDWLCYMVNEPVEAGRVIRACKLFE